MDVMEDEEMDVCEHCWLNCEDYYYDEDGNFVSRCATDCPYDLWDREE